MASVDVIFLSARQLISQITTWGVHIARQWVIAYYSTLTSYAFVVVSNGDKFIFLFWEKVRDKRIFVHEITAISSMEVMDEWNSWRY